LLDMTLRPPRSHLPAARINPLDYEIVQEQATALGRLGRALESALAALADYDRRQAERPQAERQQAERQQAERPTDDAAPIRPLGAKRERLIRNASYALWCFIVQREACGLRDQRSVIRQYSVPAEVQNRMGMVGCGGPSRPA
jgi:hypothetical protein